MSRGLLGGALGAAGATAYLKPELVQDWAKEVVFGPSAPRGGGTAPMGKELEHLQRLVGAARCCHLLRRTGQAHLPS